MVVYCTSPFGTVAKGASNRARQAGQIRNPVSIDDRPLIVSEKTRLGDWEIDTVIGKNHQGKLVAIVDRVSNSL